MSQLPLESNDYNPRSTDALFATILQRMEEADRARTDRYLQDKLFQDDMRKAQTDFGKRIADLETWRTGVKGKALMVIGALTILSNALAPTIEKWILH